MPPPQILDRPPGTGWYWWRRDRFDPWQVIEVHADHGALYSQSDDDIDYQCGDNPATPFVGQWWHERIEPPPPEPLD